MDYNTLPTIRLELEHMRHTILNHLGLRGGEYEKAMDIALKQAIKQFDFEKKMTEAAQLAIHNAIENYFSYGGKGYQFIKDTLENAFEKMYQESKNGDSEY